MDAGPKRITAPLPGTLHGVLAIGDEEVAAVTAELRRGRMFRFLNAAEESPSAKLEAAYRAYCGVPHALAVGGGGTGALICGLVGLGIGSGDEVIIPGYTYIATAAACLSVGAIPILAEIDDSLTLDPHDVERKITDHTRAIIPVHMRGTPCDMGRILDLARRHGLKVLEDVAQANGGSYRGQRLGSLGDAAAFSFQHYKMITAGEGGMLTCRDEAVYRRAAIKHDSAMQFWKPTTPNPIATDAPSGDRGACSPGPNAPPTASDWPSFAGENYRMDELRAALALVQFSRLEGLLARCRAAKAAMLERLVPVAEGLGLTMQRLPGGGDGGEAGGDCGISVNFFCDTGDRARRLSEAVAAEGVPNATIYNHQIPDRHIYPHWDYVMHKRTHDPSGWPWTAARRTIEYTPDMLPRTLALLSRCISISLNQHWTPAHAEAAATAVIKVAERVAA